MTFISARILWHGRQGKRRSKKRLLSKPTRVCGEKSGALRISASGVASEMPSRSHVATGAVALKYRLRGTPCGEDDGRGTKSRVTPILGQNHLT